MDQIDKKKTKQNNNDVSYEFDFHAAGIQQIEREKQTKQV